MANGRPGDAPWNDFFIYKRNIFPEDMARMLLAIYEVSPDLIKHLSQSDMFDWEVGENLEEGREKLQQIMAENGIAIPGAT